MRIGVDPNNQVVHPARNIVLQGLLNRLEKADQINKAIGKAAADGKNFAYPSILSYGSVDVDGKVTTAIQAAIDSGGKTFYIPPVAGGVKWDGTFVGTSRITWLIDPDATFPLLATDGPYGQTDFSSLGGRIDRRSNNTTSKQGWRLGAPRAWVELHRPFSASISELAVVSGNGQIGVGGFSRSSDAPSVNQGCIGLEGIAVNDDVTFRKPSFGLYAESWRTAPAVGAAFAEIESINLDPTVRNLDPNTVRSINSQDSMAVVFAAGGEIAGAQTSSAATATWSNGAKFWRGHVMMAGALDSLGPLEWSSIPTTYKLAWYDNVGGRISYLTDKSAQWLVGGDANTAGLQWNTYRRKADNVTATDSLDQVFRNDFFGWDGTANYNSGNIQHLQRTDFSGGNARFSTDITVRSADGTYRQVTLNGFANNTFSSDADNNLNLGAQTARWARGFMAEVRPGTGNVIITSGLGSPEGVITAAKGSLFLREDGGAATSMYKKESGSGNTGWVAF